MAVARVTEISSTSTTSFEDAIKHGLERANATLRNVKSAWIKEQQVRLEGGSISEYQVNMLVTFVLDDELLRRSESARADSDRARTPKSRRIRGGCASTSRTPRWSPESACGSDSGGANRREPDGEAPLVRVPALVTLTTTSVWASVGLWLDSHAGSTGQLVLGVLTAVVFVALLRLHTPAIRFQALGVVAIATIGEVVGSLVWGLYSYRLDNIPAFVPPGHGLVYLTGFSIAALSGRRALPVLAAAVAASWGFAGLTFLSSDVAGAIGCAFLIVVLLGTRVPVYAGVFLVVAALELYGTALGTWTLTSTVPGLGLSQGNPPSGVASGYVVFDVVALGLAARLRTVRLSRRRLAAAVSP